MLLFCISNHTEQFPNANTSLCACACEEKSELEEVATLALSGRMTYQ